jgi:hypothetical protein
VNRCGRGTDQGRRRLLSWSACAALASTAVACRSDTSAAILQPTHRMPALEHHPVHDPHVAGSTLSAVAAGRGGEVLALPATPDDGVLAVIADRTAPRYYAAPGAGPGEIRLPLPLAVDDTMVLVFDAATRRLMTFDRASGVARRELRLRGTSIPYLRGAAGQLIATRLDRGVLIPSIIDLATGRERDPVPPGDTAAIGLFAGEEDEPAYGNIAVIGRWRGGTLVANGMHYRMVLYDDEGRVAGRIDRGFAPRTLSRREVEREISRLGGTPMGRSSARLEAIRQRLEREPRPWFTHLSAPRDDGHGRLWVIVEHGDSTVADVYADQRLLGSLRLDCPGYEGRWDLAGEWLVMLCAPSDPESLEDAEIRRWRIVEPDEEMAVARGER